ncbi:MAG: relaxase/mobilization nuclease RlxS [Gammaproteobacteria bacterium]|uniref:relaxase/mobilization nuclease RlxS n=1 Tax=Thalassobaculum sp. TaxID=2022740 RepID=UPI0032ED4B3E
MTQDDDFTPRLGRIRSREGRSGKRYLPQVLRAVELAGGRSSASSGRFRGNRIGRGAGVGRVLAARDRYAAFRGRRVVVKSRIVKLQGRGLKAARLHLRYIQRDGVTREGLPGELYDAEHDRADGRAFLERAEGDRHQFRFIVSAEDAAEYDELKGFTRQLMRQVEEDLGTRLDWVAVDHHNTGHPHTHIVLRGRDDRGRDLVIARDYMTTGLRERAAEIVSLDLGPRTDREIEHRLRLEVEHERFTGLDRRLLREVGEDGLVRSGTTAGDAFRQTLRAGRLQKLRRLGLAEEVEPGHWRLAEDLEPVLRRMGERGDIIKTLHRELARGGGERSAADYAVYDPVDPGAGRLVGRVVARGLSDEINDRHYLIVDGVDGRAHYIEIGRADATDPLPDGAVVAVEPKRAEPRTVDRTITEIAAVHGGRYSMEIHLRHDPTATAAFAETHVRRLEAMRRLGAGAERQPDGSWTIAPDHLERAAAYERGRARTSPVVVETLSALPLDRQLAADGATWLDRELIADAPTGFRDAGFGREVRRALDRRRQWLVEQEFARHEQARIVYRANLLGLLRRRELTRVAGQLSDELGLRYTEPKPGERIEGTYRRRLDLASGRYALIEKSREFTLVPWRPVLERSLGKPVSGIARGDTISWSFGRKRSGPGVS